MSLFLFAKLILPNLNKRVFAPPKRNTDTKYYTGSVEEMAKAIVDTLEAERLI